MKLGILLCDHVQEQLQGEFGDYPQMFSELLLQVDSTLQIEVFDVISGKLPTDINQCDVYMTSGSRWGVTDGLAWVDQLSDFLRKLYRAKKGFVGICFGHQLLAQALGGAVTKSDKGWGIGIAFSEVSTQKNWMRPYQATLDLVVSHQDQISQLPPDSQVLVSNAFCPYAMVQVGDHFLGIQGHPEFSRDYSLALMNSRKDRIPSAVITDGAATLVQPTDAILATQWILNFLAQTIPSITGK
ncbi:MAG: GMP synthase [Gammaproteobacteria bacterium]|nr:GMP synthase [Gammaproteobacteria bacterium]